MEPSNNITKFSGDQVLADRISSLFGSARGIVSGVLGQRRKKLVFVAENDHGSLNLIDNLLRKLTSYCEVVKFTNGVNALAAVCTRPPDLIIANPSMDCVDGLRLVDQLRMDRQARKIPLLLTDRLTRSALLATLLANTRSSFSQGALG